MFTFVLRILCFIKFEKLYTLKCYVYRITLISNLLSIFFTPFPRKICEFQILLNGKFLVFAYGNLIFCFNAKYFILKFSL